MRYWFVIKRGIDGSYFYGTPINEKDNEKDEEEMLRMLQETCNGIGDTLCLLIQLPGFLPIVNQIYPYRATAESIKFLDYLLRSIYSN